MPKNLIISPIGDGNVVHTWLSHPEHRNFDVWAIDFRPGERPPPPHVTYFTRRTGFKFEHLAYLADHHAERLMQYESIWCPDDDVALATEDVNRMFALFAEYELKLAQPAIVKGDVAYRSLRPRTGAVLRYAPLVEVMCPLFSREAFFAVRDTFLANRSAWGFDWVWPCRFARDQIAILDAIGAHHTRPLASGEVYRKFASLGIDPARDSRAVVERFGGVNRLILKAFIHGRWPMRTVYDPAQPRSIWQRVRDGLFEAPARRRAG